MARDSYKLRWDLGSLHLFLDVAEQGSLTRAAAKTGSPQPALSRRLARLERECGGALFLRTGRGVELSDLGRKIHAHVLRVFAEIEALSQEVSTNSGTVTGSVRLGALPSLHMDIIVPLFAKLRSTFPGIHLQVLENSSGQIDQWLITGKVDIGLTYRNVDKRDPSVERLARIGTYLIGRRDDPKVQARTIRFADLSGLPLVLPGTPSGIRTLYDQVAKRTKTRLNVVLEADSMWIQKGTVLQGHAYSIMPLHSVARDIDDGLLRATRIVQPKIDRDIALVATSARPTTAAARTVIRILHTLFGNPLHEWLPTGVSSATLGMSSRATP